MAGTKISDATLRSALKGTENLPIVDSDLPKGRTNISAIKTYVKSDLNEYLKKAEAQNAYQPKGEYAMANDLTSLQTEFDNLTMEQIAMYGVERDKTVSSSKCTRIGNMVLHKTLPIHNLMKGCLLSDEGEVNKYLDANDWTSEQRDGSEGQVMVEVPEHWWHYETEGNIQRVKLSVVSLPGYIHVPKYYVSAYEASLQRTGNKLSSVINTTADFRGGNNNDAWDGTYRSLLGMPATSINRTNFLAYARNRGQYGKNGAGWNCMTYDIQKDLYWLYVVEYATLNTQDGYNPAKTSEGYMQGGMGAGVTNLDYTKWDTFNNRCPFIPCGYTDELGNGGGQKAFLMPDEYDTNTLTTQVPRWHGIENIFGHIWEWVEGINIRIEPGDGVSAAYVCDDPSKFNSTNYTGYRFTCNIPRSGGFIKEIAFGENGDILPIVVGGSSSTFFGDYFYTSIPTSVTLRGVLFGGDASVGSSAGLVCSHSHNAPSNVAALIGSRLCFLPA